MALCHSCDDVLRNIYYRQNADISGPIHNTCRSFLAAVDEGCPICQELFQQASDETKKELRRNVDTPAPSLRAQHNVADKERSVTWYFKDSMDSTLGSVSIGIYVSMSLSVYPITGEPAHWGFSSLSTSSGETFTKIKAWLGRCGKTHAKCRLPRDVAGVEWHPTRLIEISPDPDTGENANNLSCRVVEPQSEDIPQNLRYVTLSHRWPQDQEGFQILTTDKLPLWKENLPMAILHQTFRDAFLAARRLGISYIWIDSLCIIQEGDDDADWRKESPMMQKVYSNAELNICASKTDQNQGLFSTRNPPRHQPLHIQLARREGDTHSGHFLIRRESGYDFMTTWERAIDDSVLASRGWVFQEQLLSRANLHFGDHEVLFECMEMRACESLGSEQDYSMPWTWHGLFFKQLLPKGHVVSQGEWMSSDTPLDSADYHHKSTQHDDLVHKLWHKLLSQYTSRQLTKSGDRLVALSGVAQQFKTTVSKDNCYIAGLWSNHLATEMLWQVTDRSPGEGLETQKSTRHHLTFSWVSAQGTVRDTFIHHLDGQSLKPLADLVPIRYRMSSETMIFTGGEGEPFVEDIFSLPPTPTVEIRMTGFLRPMVLNKEYSDSHKLYIRIGMDGSQYQDPGLWERFPTLHGVTLDFEIGSSQLPALNTSGRLFLMPLLEHEKYFVWYFLLELVDESDGNSMGRFRRIGVHRDGGPSRRTLFTERGPSDDALSKLPCWRYDRHTKKHTIFVI